MQLHLTIEIGFSYFTASYWRLEVLAYKLWLIVYDHLLVSHLFS